MFKIEALSFMPELNDVSVAPQLQAGPLDFFFLCVCLVPVDQQVVYASGVSVWKRSATPHASDTIRAGFRILCEKLSGGLLMLTLWFPHIG